MRKATQADAAWRIAMIPALLIALMATASCSQAIRSDRATVWDPSSTALIAIVESHGGRLNVRNDVNANGQHREPDEIDFSNCHGVTSATIALLPRTSSVRSLDLSDTPITGESLADIPLRFPNLEILGLKDTAVSDEHLMALRDLPRLRTLCVSGTEVTDEGLAVLLEHPRRLHVLRVNGTRITDAMLVRLRQAHPGVVIESFQRRPPP